MLPISISHTQVVHLPNSTSRITKVTVLLQEPILKKLVHLLASALFWLAQPAPAQTADHVFTLDPSASQIRMYAFRAGQARQFGHNHVLAAPRFTGEFVLSSQGPGQSHFDLAFRLDELEFDNPSHRSETGAAFATTLAPALIESTREHMLGEFNFQANQFPWVRIKSLQIVGETPRFAARIAVEMHGQQREAWVALNVQGLPERLQVEGSMVLVQSDFGVKPYSVLGGLLAVEDPVVIEFRLAGADK